MKTISNFYDFVNEKECRYKKATLIKYKRKFDAGEDIPFGIENSLKAMGMIPRENGEIMVSNDYEDSSMMKSLRPKTAKPGEKKKKTIKESIEDDIIYEHESPVEDGEITFSVIDKNGKTVEVSEIEGAGMAGESMTFAYILHDRKISSREKVKDLMKPADYKELCNYLDDIADNNQASAISYIK